MLDCSVSAASETLSMTSVPTPSNCHAVHFPDAFFCFLHLCVRNTHAMTHVEVTAQFSGVIFSYHRDVGTELKSLGLTTGAFTCPPSCGHTPKYIQCTFVSGGFGRKNNECLERFSFVGRIKDIIFFSFRQHFLSNILPVKITAVPQNLS